MPTLSEYIVAKFSSMASARARLLGQYLRSSYPLFIGNQARVTEQALPVTDKFTGKRCADVSAASLDSIDEAISAAVDAKKAMKDLTGYQRKDILSQVALQLSARKEEVATILAVEAGKTITEANIEVGRAVDTFTLAAEESIRRYGEWQPLDISDRNAGFSCISRPFPAGVVSMISPFNFPLNLSAHKIAPAIAAGCPFVLKPSDRTPVSAVLLGEMLAATALPEGAFSIVPCLTEHAYPLSQDPRLNVLSFTGSPEIGWKLKSQAGEKKVVLELGGNAACILDEDCDVNTACSRVTFGAFYQAGQSCISVQRLYVHESIYEEAKSKLIELAAGVNENIGDPLEESTSLGPLISLHDAIRVEEMVNQAVMQGATILTGGKRNNQFYEATIVENVSQQSELFSQEVFGPVFIIDKFQSFKDACAQVNNSSFGLQAGVFTNNLNKAFYAFENLEVGGVIINDVPSVRVDAQPYGGVKGSGIGREGIRWAMQDFSEVRVMLMKNVGKL